MARCVGEALHVRFRQFPDNSSRHASNENPCGQRRVWQDDAARCDQRSGADTRSTEDDRADPYERTGLDVRTVHGCPVAEADLVLQDRGFAGIYVHAAQVLDIALGADDNAVIVCPQDASVPNRRRPA